MSKDAVAEPIGMVTLAGTVASVASLEESVTSSALLVSPVRVTVPTDAGFAALSEKLLTVVPRESVRLGGATANPLTPGDPMVRASVV
jgi:hypothetical protein